MVIFVKPNYYQKFSGHSIEKYIWPPKSKNRCAWVTNGGVARWPDTRNRNGDAGSAARITVALPTGTRLVELGN
jgi:hypothetical protein